MGEGSILIDESSRAARNPYTPPEVLATLSNHKYWDVRWDVAENPNTSSDTLASMVNDVDLDVRYRVAENPNTPYGIWVRKVGRVLP